MSSTKGASDATYVVTGKQHREPREGGSRGGKMRPPRSRYGAAGRVRNARIRWRLCPPPSSAGNATLWRCHAHCALVRRNTGVCGGATSLLLQTIASEATRSVTGKCLCSAYQALGACDVCSHRVIGMGREEAFSRLVELVCGGRLVAPPQSGRFILDAGSAKRSSPASSRLIRGSRLVL